jgi:hypothetical protein
MFQALRILQVGFIISSSIFMENLQTNNDALNRKYDTMNMSYIKVSIVTFCCILSQSLLFSQSTYTLTVENGYGAGEYKAGDTVWVFSREMHATDSIFSKWQSNVSEPTVSILTPREWRTQVVMPDHNTTIQATFRQFTMPESTEDSIQIANSTKPFWYIVPSDLEKIKGMILLFHGTGGSRMGWRNQVENWSFVRSAIARNFAVFATDAEEVLAGDLDNNDKIRWSPFPVNLANNVDHKNIQILLDTLRWRGIITDSLPLFTMGMSNGGAYSPAVAFTLHEEQNIRASVSYCAEGTRILFNATTIPMMWNMASQDQHPEIDIQKAFDNYMLMQDRSISAEYFANPPAPVYDERFARIEGVSIQKSQDIVNELRANSLLDESGYLTVFTDSLITIIQENITDFPALLSIKASERIQVIKQLSISIADHQFFSDRNNATLDFFERFIADTTPTTVSQDNRFLPKTFHLFPNPAQDIVNIHIVDPNNEFHEGGQSLPKVAVIVDMLGRTFKRIPINTKERGTLVRDGHFSFHTQVKDIPNGVYLVQMLDGMGNILPKMSATLYVAR